VIARPMALIALPAELIGRPGENSTECFEIGWLTGAMGRSEMASAAVDRRAMVLAVVDLAVSEADRRAMGLVDLAASVVDRGVMVLEAGRREMDFLARRVMDSAGVDSAADLQEVISIFEREGRTVDLALDLAAAVSGHRGPVQAAMRQ